jgi:hypothetical protein
MRTQLLTPRVESFAMSETQPSKAQAQSETPPVSAQRIPHRRNQLLAVTLVSVTASLFIIVVGLVILLHYAETHHLLAAL